MARNQIIISTMSNILSMLLRHILNFISNISDYLSNIPEFFINSRKKIDIFLHDQLIKFKNLTETNIELGKHHLYNGNIKDAIIRFRLAKMFFDQDNPEIDYWLGWCYFMKGDYLLASESLKHAKNTDEENLASFIQNPEEVDQVPSAIWDRVRTIKMLEGNQKYYAQNIYNKPIEIPLEFVELFLKNIKEMPPGLQILDFGCQNGLVGSFLDYKTDAQYYITGVDEFEICIEYARNIRGERGFVYDQTILSPVSDIKNAIGQKKYDVIFSFDSMSFIKNFSRYFDDFYTALNNEGYFVIMLPAGRRTIWDPKKISFIYDGNDIADQLKLAKFDIIDIKEWSMGKSEAYTAFVCIKS